MSFAIGKSLAQQVWKLSYGRGPPGSPETETTLLPVRLPGSCPKVQTAHFEMIRVLYSLKPHPRMRTSTQFYPESNKRSPTSDDPVTCPLGSSHGLICSSAQLQGRSLEAPPLGYAQGTCCWGCEKGRNCWHVIGAAFISGVRSSSC